MIDNYWFKSTRPLDVILQHDPAEGLVQHAMQMKPYHSKVYEIVMDYVYFDDLVASMSDELEIRVDMRSGKEGEQPELLCGPGFDSAYNFGYGIYWGGGYGSPERYPGYQLRNDFVDIIEAVGTFSQSENAGSFLIDEWQSEKYHILVTDLINNQMTFVTYHDMISYDYEERKFIISGNVLEAVEDSMEIYVPSTNTDQIRFTVTDVVLNSGGNTEITVLENIPIRTTVNPIGIPLDHLLLPWWWRGAKVKISGTDLPSPLDPDGTYYFAPIEKYGVFGLAHTPSPKVPSDAVRFDAFNMTPIEIWTDEPFFAGIKVEVTGAENANNDGLYTIIKTKREGKKMRLWTMEPVKVSNGSGGAMSHVQISTPVTEVFCKLVDGPQLMAQTYMQGNLHIALSKVDESGTIETEIDVDVRHI